MALSCAFAPYPAPPPFNRRILLSDTVRHLGGPYSAPPPYIFCALIRPREKAVDSLYSELREVDNLVAHNSTRLLRAFQNARVGSHHFGGCTGYGHDEGGGCGALDNLFAEILGAESAIVRSQFFSGTYAITCVLFAFLRPGDKLLAVAGTPYDTLEEVIGIRNSSRTGSLKDFGVAYREVPVTFLLQ